MHITKYVYKRTESAVISCLGAFGSNEVGYIYVYVCMFTYRYVYIHIYVIYTYIYIYIYTY
jgi:hypothetical protein